MSTSVDRIQAANAANNAMLSSTRPPTWRWYLLAFLLGALVAAGLYAFTYQVLTGMVVTGINRPVMWGLYIINFVFWVGLSHSGTMVSAILRLSHANWRRPILRGAEAMTVFSITVGGLFPLIHLGRNWTFYYMIPYPTQYGLWPNFRSPLLWDMIIQTQMWLVLRPSINFWQDDQKLRGTRASLSLHIMRLTIWTQRRSAA